MVSRGLGLAVLFIGIVSAVGIAFQNCSQVSFEAAKTDSSLAAADTPLDVQSFTTKVSARNIPPLKLFFIVDNSYTMKENQINLAQSFQNMFATSGGKSLERFATTAYLMNTAQRSPEWTSNDRVAIQNLQKSPADLELMSSSQIGVLRTASVNTGTIPGDNLGFGHLSTPTSISFFPAMVLGLQDNGAGRILASPTMSKGPGESADALAVEFQRRLALLDAMRIPLLNDGTQQFANILDKESGLCAMARVLRNNASLVSPGDQVAFVLASDEDDSDPSGASCVQSYNEVSSADDLIKGYCEERKSTLSYKAGEACKVRYATGYNFKYSWIQDKVTEVTYRKLLSSGGYSVPQTMLSYYKQSITYIQLYTKVTYYLKSLEPIIFDNVKVGDREVFKEYSATVAGDVRASCQAAALALNSNAVVNNPSYQIKCEQANKDVPSCSSGDLNCKANAPTYTFAQKAIDGSYANGTPCDDQVKKLGGFIDATHPASCTPTSSPRSGSGSCTTALLALGCVNVPPKYDPLAKWTVDGSYDTSSACYNLATTLPGSAVDANNPPSCAVSTPDALKAARSHSGILSYASSGDGGTTVPGPTCGSLGDTIYNNLVKPKFPFSNPSGKCELSAAMADFSLATSISQDCQLQAQEFCSANASTRRNCSGSKVTATMGAISLPSKTRDINCSDSCSSQDYEFCVATSGMTVTPEMSIDSYLKARYGSTTQCFVEKSSLKVAGSDFVDRKLSEKDSICVGTKEKPYYIKTIGLEYRQKEVVKDFVSGTTKLSAGNYQPALGLIDYINARSTQVLGAAKPILSAFVRTAEDGTGTSGSVGLSYQALAAVMGGKVVRVTSSDYSPAFQELGRVIQDRLERSFTIVDMRPTQSVHLVQIRRAGLGDWIDLAPDQWTASGNSVTIENSVSLDLEDELRFEYY